MKLGNGKNHREQTCLEEVVRRVVQGGKRCGEIHHILRRLGLPCSVFCFFLIALNASSAFAARRAMGRAPGCDCSSNSFVEQRFSAEKLAYASKELSVDVEKGGECHRQGGRRQVAHRAIHMVPGLLQLEASRKCAKNSQKVAFAQIQQQLIRPTFSSSGREIVTHVAPKNSPPA